MLPVCTFTTRWTAQNDVIQQKENVDPWHERLVIADLWIFIIATEVHDFAY